MAERKNASPDGSRFSPKLKARSTPGGVCFSKSGRMRGSDESAFSNRRRSLSVEKSPQSAAHQSHASVSGTRSHG